MSKLLLNTRVLGAVMLAGVAARAQAQTVDVPLALAQERAARISNLHYDVRFTVPAERTERIRVRETVRFDLSDASRPISIDFFTDSSSHIVIPAAELRKGANELHFDVLAGDASLNRNPDYLYTLFVPARAAFALPVFDQPDMKARWKLTLDIPASWTAVANGAAQNMTSSDGTKTIEFAETRPLPTYLFGFAAGKWNVETGTRTVGAREMTFHMYHRENDTLKVARNRDAIFDLVAHSIEFMESYTGIPYGFDKYDFVAVPAFQFGGMEHAGAVLYQASTLFLDESATQNQRLGRASLIAHETAHMWFGDLVTMRWFNDVWLKEVMANFMAAKIVQPSFPDVNHRLRFMLSNYPAAYDVDRTAGTHPIRQDLANLNEAAQLYGAIIYQKAPIVMAQLESIVGAANFQRGMQQYLGTNAYGNAVFNDMIAALQPYTNQDLRAWSQAWVERAGRPMYATGSRCLRAFASSCEQSWPQQLHPAALAPGVILPNGNGVAYGLFKLNPKTRAWLLANLPRIKDPLVRAAAWLDMWDAMLEHEVTPQAMLYLELRALQSETDEQLSSLILGNLSETYWRYLTGKQRSAAAAGVEQVLKERLAVASTSSKKAAVFSALRSVASTPATLNWLHRVWLKADSVPGLKLSEDDYVPLAASLVIKGFNADSILDAQAQRIANPDRRARFDFVRPALSPDANTRDAWFELLRKRENRTHEPWVLEGLNYLNHPLRTDHAVKYVRPSLDLLAEIRATGDIFFPKRWLDAAFSGHSSFDAARIIREFVASHPNYPPRLRQLVLQSADPVFRASRH